MFSRENWPGIALIGLCAIVAIALLVEIFTDVRWVFTNPVLLADGRAKNPSHLTADRFTRVFP